MSGRWFSSRHNAADNDRETQKRGCCADLLIKIRKVDMTRVKFIACSVLLYFVSLLVLSGQASAAAAYRIAWLNVTNRVYADEEGNVNRLQFAVTDDQGNYILGTSGEFVDFNSVELYDPSDKKVSMSEITFYPDYEFKEGRFDSVSGGWDFDTPVVFYEFQANILEPLVPGVYELRLKCDDGVTYTATKIFNQLVTIPLVPSAYYQIHPDSDGNVYFSWDIPSELIELAKSYDLQYRPYVSVNNGGQLAALLWPSAPIHINMLFIPNSVVQWLAGKGTSFSFGVHARTSDGQNRSHPKPLIVNDMLTTVTKKKQVVVVPMF